MPSALYGFLFLSDCTNGSYRDGSHALRWKHSTLDHGLLLFHLTYIHTHTRTHTHTHTHTRRHAQNKHTEGNKCMHTFRQLGIENLSHTLTKNMDAHARKHAFIYAYACSRCAYVCHTLSGWKWLPAIRPLLQRVSLKLSNCIGWQTGSLKWNTHTCHRIPTWSIQITTEPNENEIELKWTELIRNGEVELISGESHRHVAKQYKEFIQSCSFPR